MNKNERTYSINGQDKTFAELTIDERIQLLRAAVDRPVVVSFGKAPKDGWKESDRVAK